MMIKKKVRLKIRCEMKINVLFMMIENKDCPDEILGEDQDDACDQRGKGLPCVPLI